MCELNGRVAVVTGLARGIGRAMAERFAREGIKVVLADAIEPTSVPRSPSYGPTASKRSVSSPM